MMAVDDLFWTNATSDISQLHTDVSIKDYVLKLLASFLSGSTKQQKFHIWTGSGSNGKSFLVELFMTALGTYCSGISLHSTCRLVKHL